MNFLYNKRFHIAAVILLLLVFSPILFTGLYSDDLMNFIKAKSWIAIPSPGFISLANELTMSVACSGRFAPLAFFWQEAIFQFVPNVFALKLINYSLCVTCALAFLWYVCKLFPQLSPLFFVVCYATMVQFRINYHDPYTSLNAMFPLMNMWLFISGGCLVNYIEHNQKNDYIFSILFFMATLLIMEYGLVAVVMHFFALQIKHTSIRKSVILLVPFIVIALCYLSCIFWLRINITDEHAMYNGLRSNFDFIEMSLVVAKQVFATLPLTDILEEYCLPTRLLKQLWLHNNLFVVLLLMAITIGSLYFTKPTAILAMKNIRTEHILWCICLLLLPAIILSPSMKYQGDFKWGNAYVPIHLQVFGAATLFCLLIQKYWHLLWMRRLFSVMAACIITLQFLYHHLLLTNRNLNDSEPSLLLAGAFNENWSSAVAAGSLAVLDFGNFWWDMHITTNCIEHATGKKYELYRPSEVTTKREIHTPCYYIDVQKGDTMRVLLYTIDSLHGEKKSPLVLRQATASVPFSSFDCSTNK